MVVLLYGIARRNMSLIGDRHESSLHFKCLARVAAGSLARANFWQRSCETVRRMGTRGRSDMVLAFRGFNSHTPKNALKRNPPSEQAIKC